MNKSRVIVMAPTAILLLLYHIDLFTTHKLGAFAQLH
jgi:hypothetical protein